MIEWSIRALLNPVITRLLIYGVNPIDLEYVISVAEKTKHLNSRSLEKCWLEQWEKKADKYINLAIVAEANSNKLSAKVFYNYASHCYYAIFLINLSSIEDKKRIYSQYAYFYKKSLEFENWKAIHLQIELAEKKTLSGYLHLPESESKKNCVIIYSGLGSCKEEMHTLAKPLIERDIAVFIPDMPGNGETLFINDLKCNIDILNLAFIKILDNLEKRTELTGIFATFGLCMGGGYSYKAASLDSRYMATVNLFPLRITQVAPLTTPQWMKKGNWYDYQTGGIKAEDFIIQMKELEDASINCPYLFIHGKNDNWMTLETAMDLYNNAKGIKEKIIVEEEAVFSNQQLVTHTMPVGEQLHWLRHVAADWMSKQLEGIRKV